jgi:hypothetical protein
LRGPFGGQFLLRLDNRPPGIRWRTILAIAVVMAASELEKGCTYRADCQNAQFPGHEP